jgi:hypothetical protein
MADSMAGKGRFSLYCYSDMQSRRAFIRYIPPGLLTASLVTVFVSTLAPGLTWANGGSDGGDLIAAAATGGVAHPTGYPLYLLLARLFQLLPIGSLAFRTNLMSAIVTALGAALVYVIVTSSLPPSRTVQSWTAGMAAGYAFGLAPLIWSQAVITEVYALQAFLILLILYLYAFAKPGPASGAEQSRLSRWRGLALGLAMGNHLTTILLVPVALLLGCIHSQPEPYGGPHAARSWFRTLKLDAASLLRQLVWFSLGLCLYLIIPLRALAHPPINWGNAVTPQRLWWLVSGQLYQSYYLEFTLAGLWERIQAWAALLLEQFGLPGVLLGVIGLLVFGSRSRLYALTAWMAAVSLAFAFLYRSEDSYVYLIPLFISFAIWIGLGIGGLVNGLSGRLPILGLGIGLILMSYFIARSVTQLSEVDASGDHRAESFGREVLSAAPENAMVFAEGDRAVFTLWYYHFGLGERPDLAVMAADLLHFDWYQENLKSTYPSLVMPGPFPWPSTVVAANPSRPACYVQYADQTEIQIAGPLATP